MAGTARKSAVPIQALGSLTEEQARELYRQGEEAVVFALLELTKQLAEARSPSVTPHSWIKKEFPTTTTTRSDRFALPSSSAKTVTAIGANMVLIAKPC